jgi:hypothetical protein
MKKREITYGVVLDLGDDDEVLATWGGSIIVGTIEDLRRVFGGMVTRFVPIDAKTTVSLVAIREHAPGMFVKLVDGQCPKQ